MYILLEATNSSFLAQFTATHIFVYKFSLICSHGYPLKRKILLYYHLVVEKQSQGGFFFFFNRQQSQGVGSSLSFSSRPKDSQQLVCAVPITGPGAFGPAHHSSFHFFFPKKINEKPYSLETKSSVNRPMAQRELLLMERKRKINNVCII